MYNDERPQRRLYVASIDDDKVIVSPGSLIPSDSVYSIPEVNFHPKSVKTEVTIWYLRPAILLSMSVLIFAASLGSAGYAVFSGNTLAAAPILYVAADNLPEPKPLNYGVEMALTQPDFFAETLNTFKDNQSSFIEADLSAMEIRYYENGEVVFESPILSKGKEGSWWETPAGLYEVELKKDNHFSSFGQVYQPWSMVFQGNFFIHGWPYYPDGTPVPEGYSGGCIRLDTADAEALYKLVDKNTPVLVYEESFASDNFLYEPKVPELTAPHYLLADLKSSTVLAASDIDESVPIASITKLMTALIAAEYINLDKDVSVHQELYVTSLIPRLQGRYRVSMYSLLQLLLVESSNEAAEVIATQLGRDRFINLMNQKAESLGLVNTVFTDPSGLDDGNVSSVGDLLRLLQYIYHNRSFVLELTADQNLPSAYTNGQFGTLENFNEIDGVDSFIGGKVGETLAAGQTSVSLHKVQINNEERVIAIVLLGSDGREADVKTLLRYVDDRFAD